VTRFWKSRDSKWKKYWVQIPEHRLMDRAAM
jgi:hypothetical protein